MSEKHLYQVDLKWKEGRIGEVSSPDLDMVIECATPPEFPQGVANIWSPEHFFAAAINSCFMTTFLAVSENSKLEFESFECKTVITLELIDRRFLISEAEIQPMLELTHPEKDGDKALRVLEKSSALCLVTHSMKTEIKLNPRLVNLSEIRADKK